MLRKILLASATIALSICGTSAQGTFEEFKSRIDSEFNSYKSARDNEFEAFRKRINDEYAAMVRKAWGEYNAMRGIPLPDDNPLPPVIYPMDGEAEPIKDKPMPIDEIIPLPAPEPQPAPIVPIEEKPTPSVEERFEFIFYGTTMRLRLDDKMRFAMDGCDENTVAEVWNWLAESEYENTVNDCLALRTKYKLCDWAYLSMLRAMTTEFFGEWGDEATMLTAFIYCQSGYQMRLANGDGRLFMLYASRHTIYGTGYWDVDGEKFYALGECPQQIRICQAAYPKEKPLSLMITSEQLLTLRQSRQRSLQSRDYADVRATVKTNENLIAFFDTYPSSMIGDDFGTRWAIYANTPMSEEAAGTLYPSLRTAIDGKPQREAVERLLDFVQTAFTYEYDDKVWGGDRAFFAEETLYYPYCDCEDRSILFSRLVRDLLGLDVVLVYYPNHLATAVRFTDKVADDHIILQNDKYTVCDPTYIGAPVGATMPDMDNTTAKIIMLE